MSEAFLHYIWQHQYFDKRNLQSTSQSKIEVLKTGFLNFDSGPDFKFSKIIIDGIEWNGHVEVHCKSSDWYHHNHHLDKAYDSTVLHVVWEDNKPVKRTDGSYIPTLALQNRVFLSLLRKHDQLINNPQHIPCDTLNKDINNLTKISAQEDALIERLKRKSEEVMRFFHLNNNDWEETTYQLLARAMGFKKNSDALHELSHIIPFSLLKKHSNNGLQIEALLFGASGLINSNDDYALKLKKEYAFLKSKYQIEKSLNLNHWKFLRMRPANFPTVRIAQLASITKENSSLFACFLEKESTDIIDMLQKEVSPYWKNHYAFGKKSPERRATLGIDSASTICINVVVIILMAYSKHIDNQYFQDKAIDLLASLKAENNVMTRKMTQSGFINKTAQDSQALIELYSNYCLKKKCLDCKVGTELITP